MASDCSGGSRLAVAANWQRTSMFGSVSATLAIRMPMSDGSTRVSPSSRTVQSRTCGSGWSIALRAVASSSPPDRFRAQSDSTAACPFDAKSLCFNAGTTDESLRSARPRRAASRCQRLA